MLSTVLLLDTNQSRVLCAVLKMLKIVLLVTCTCQLGVSYNILASIPFYSISHFNVFSPLFKTLSERGHNVTVISFFPWEERNLYYKDVSLKGTVDSLMNAFLVNKNHDARVKKHNQIFDLSQMSQNYCNRILASKCFHTFMEGNHTYDVVMIELFPSACMLGILDRIKAPLIVLSTCNLLPWIPQYFGQPDNPSYCPTFYMSFPNKMPFFERVENTYAYIFNALSYKYYFDVSTNNMVRKYFRDDVAHLDTFMYNASLIFVNTHFTYLGAKPLVPTVVEVGGIHVGQVKKLPKNIEKWINESTHGVIYFSMGSMIKGHTFPEEKRNMFLRAFGRLQQRVLWKWENDTMPKKPDNVMIQKWMPQFDILCHPNVKAFISHGGLLGTTEAVHCGVPAVVMPQYGDQYTNARALEASGGGVILQFSTLTEEDVYNSLKTVLDPSFNKKAKELSERFRDRPMPPLETAIYWVEYVARHKGAPHLRTAAVGMPLYQYLLLDVIAFLLLVFAILTYTSYVVIKFIFRKLFKKQTKEKEN